MAEGQAKYVHSTPSGKDDGTRCKEGMEKSKVDNASDKVPRICLQTHQKTHTAQMPSLVFRQFLRFELYFGCLTLGLADVFIRVHCGSGRLRRAFTASSFLTFSVLWLQEEHRERVYKKGMEKVEKPRCTLARAFSIRRARMKPLVPWH